MARVASLARSQLQRTLSLSSAPKGEMYASATAPHIFEMTHFFGWSPPLTNQAAYQKRKNARQASWQRPAMAEFARIGRLLNRITNDVLSDLVVTSDDHCDSPALLVFPSPAGTQAESRAESRRLKRNRDKRSGRDRECVNSILSIGE